MTAVAACGYTALPSAGVADPEHTPHRNVRVPDHRWNPFGFAVGARNRSAFLNDVMDVVNEDPQLWRDVQAIAAARGETWGSVVQAHLRRYRARNRHLLDDSNE
jgi:hypothetical protein